MYKVLIVDEENITRVALQTAFSWEKNGFQLVGSASGGREALALLENTKADIILTDLKLPHMEGLELIQQLQEQHYDGKIIVFGNYNDLDLVMEALKLGATDYLLKLTLSSDELFALLHRLKEQLESERQLRNDQIKNNIVQNEQMRMAKNNVLRELLLGESAYKTVITQLKSWGIEFVSPGGYYMFHIVVDQYETAISKGKIKDKKLLAFSIANIVKDTIGISIATEIIEVDSRNIAVLFFDSVTPYFGNDKMATAQSILRMLRQYLDLQISIVVSRDSRNWIEISEVYRECRAATAMQFYLGYSSIMDSQTCKFTDHSGNMRLTIAEVRRLINIGEKEQAIEKIRFELDAMETYRTHPAIVKKFADLLINELNQLALEWEANGLTLADRYRFELHQIDLMSELKTELLTIIIQIDAELAKIKGSKYRTEVSRAIDYIKANLSSKLTVGIIAGQVNMNEDYFSRLFKAETGSNLIQFINDMRMERALELLRDPNVKVKEVAAAIGIDDPYYFMKTMKKHCGHTPSEYKRKVLGR